MKRTSSILYLAAGTIVVLSTLAWVLPFNHDCIQLTIGQVKAVLRLLSPEQREWVSRASEIACKSPRLETLQAAAYGDYRLVAVIGFRRFHPGIPEDVDKEISLEYQYDFLEVGMGDCSYCKYDGIYQSYAYEYAKKYNETIWPFYKRWKYKKTT